MWEETRKILKNINDKSQKMLIFIFIKSASSNILHVDPLQGKNQM